MSEQIKKLLVNTPQAFTELEKAQGRANLGIGNVSDHAVLYDQQLLTISQQDQARSNIDAAKNAVATHSNNGLMSITDKVKLDGIEAQIQSNWNQSDNTKVDFIKNKPTIPAAQVNSDWNASSGVAEILNKPTLATVATSGSYNDLNNRPSIPAAQVNSDWNANSGVAQILNKPSLATVATSGSYNDLNNKPDLSVYATQTDLVGKQDVLTAGTNIQINNNVISATDTKYTAGTNVSINANNVISAVDTTYTAGDGISINQYDNNKISWVKPTGFAETTNLWFENAGDFPFMGWTITDNGQAGVKSHGYPQIYITNKSNMTEAPSPGPGGGVGYVILNPGVWQINYAIPFYTDVAGTEGGVVSINCYATAMDMVSQEGGHVAYNHINVNRNLVDITYWVEMNFSVRAVNQTQIYFDAEIIQNGSSDGLAIKLRRGPFNAVQIR